MPPVSDNESRTASLAATAEAAAVIAGDEAGISGFGESSEPGTLDYASEPTSLLLEGNIRQAVLFLALPVLGEQVLNTCVAWNDMLLAGRISVSATAAVGFAAYVSWLMGMLFALVGIGATAIVSRAIGGGRPQEARHATNQAVLLAICMGAIATLAIWSGAHPLTTLMKTSALTRDTAARFMCIEGSAYIIEAITFVGAACLRGAGDTRTPMMILGIVNIVNITASWGFAFGMKFGVEGIAWGTVTARFVGGMIMLWLLCRRREDLKLTSREMRPDKPLIWRIIRIGGPAAMDGGLMWCGHMAFLTIVTRSGGGFSGDTLSAAHMVGIRIESLSFLPAMAWATAAATLVGQNLGAGNPERARRCAHEAVRHTVLLLTCMGLFYFCFARYFFAVLQPDSQVVACGVPALRGLGCVQPALACLIVYMHSLRGAGDTLFPMVFTVIGVLGLRIPVAYVGGIVFKGALLGAWCGMFIDLIVRSGLMAWRFRSGRWMHARV